MSHSNLETASPLKQPFAPIRLIQALLKYLGWEGWLLIGALLAFAYFQSRQPFHFIHIDEGVWLEQATRMAAGQIPDRDFTWVFPPLGIALPALWIKLFGNSLLSFRCYMDTLGFMISLSLWQALRAMTLPPLTATIGILFAVISSTLLPNTQLFSFNLYTTAFLVSAVGGSLCLMGLCSFRSQGQRGWLGVAGLGMAIAALSKHEAAAASIAIALVFTGLYGWQHRRSGKAWLSDVAILWLTAIIPTVIGYMAVAIFAGPEYIAIGLKGDGAGGKVLSANPLEAGLAFFTSVLAGWRTRLTEIRASLPWLCIGAGLIGWIVGFCETGAERSTTQNSLKFRIKVWLPALVVGLGLGQLLLQLRGSGIPTGKGAVALLSLTSSLVWSAKWLPLLYLIGVLWNQGRGLTRRHPQSLLIWGLTLLSIYSLVSSSRTFLVAEAQLVPNYSVFLPIVSLIWVGIIYQASELLRSVQWRQWAVLSGLSGLLAMVCIYAGGSAWLNHQPAPLVTAHGTVTASATTAATLNPLLQFIWAETAPTDSLLGLPYGGLNYLSDRPGATGQINYYLRLPPQKIQLQIQQLTAKPPALIVIGNFPVSGFNWEADMKRIQPELFQFIDTHYRLDRRIGNQNLWYDIYRMNQKAPA